MGFFLKSFHTFWDHVFDIFFNINGFACLQWQFELRSGFNIFRLKNIYTSVVPIYKRSNIIPKVKRHEHRPTGYVRPFLGGGGGWTTLSRRTGCNHTGIIYIYIVSLMRYMWSTVRTYHFHVYLTPRVYACDMKLMITPD